MNNCETTLEMLDDLIELVWEAIEIGTQSVQEFFGMKEAAIDSALAPNVFRYSAKTYLNENRWKVPGLIIHDIPSNGLSMEYRGHHLRIWKETGEELPDPGTSRIKYAFLKQIHLAFGELFPELVSEKPDNLALIWNVDGEYNIEGVRLAKPSNNSSPEVAIQAEWNIPLEHPAFKQTLPETQFKYDVYDLPLEQTDDFKEDATHGADDIRREDQTS